MEKRVQSLKVPVWPLVAGILALLIIILFAAVKELFSGLVIAGGVVIVIGVIALVIDAVKKTKLMNSGIIVGVGVILAVTGIVAIIISSGGAVNQNKAWSAMTTGTQDDLWCVWGSSSSDVFSCGKSGSITHYDGKGWSTMTSGTQDVLIGLWGSSPSDVFAGGANGTILHCDGYSWSPMASGSTEYIAAFWGSNPSDVFAAGDHGTLLHYNGQDWGIMTTGTPSYFGGLWGDTSSNVFVVGSMGTILHYDGKSWSSMTSSTKKDLIGIWGSSPSDVFAVGNGGAIVHYDGSSWSAMTSGSQNNLWGIWGNSRSDIFAVGDSGTILHYDGKAWSSMVSGTTNRLLSIWGSSSSDVFAVGDNGTILRYSSEAVNTTGRSQADQRADVVQFLKQMNDSGNNLLDFMDSSEISGKLNSSDTILRLSAYDSMIQHLESLRLQFQMLIPPADVPELAELKNGYVNSLVSFGQLLQQIETAIRNQDAQRQNELNTKLNEFFSSPEIAKIDQLENSIMAKYNITDSEVDRKPSTPPSNAQSQIFSDDFSNPSSGWDIAAKSQYGEIAYSDGEYSAMANNAVDTTLDLSNSKIGRISDCSVEVDVRKISNGTNEYAGIAFRKQAEEDSAYYFIIRGDGRYIFLIFSQGKGYTLGDWTKSNYIKTGTSTNRIGITCQGSKIDLYANGYKLDTKYDSSFTSGSVGLAIGTIAQTPSSIHYNFDNFTVIAP